MTNHAAQLGWDSFGILLADSRKGSREALGPLLVSFRPMLRQRAHSLIGRDLRSKAWPSDLVQETFLVAQRDLARFRGHTQAEMECWLQRILKNNARRLWRKYRFTQKRRVSREVSLDDPAANGNAIRSASVQAGETPVSQLIELEWHAEVKAAMRRLSAVHRRVMWLRLWKSWSFEKIGIRLGCSADAARKLFGRVLSRLSLELTCSQIV